MFLVPAYPFKASISASVNPANWYAPSLRRRERTPKTSSIGSAVYWPVDRFILGITECAFFQTFIKLPCTVYIENKSLLFAVRHRRSRRGDFLCVFRKVTCIILVMKIMKHTHAFVFFGVTLFASSCLSVDNHMLRVGRPQGKAMTFPCDLSKVEPPMTIILSPEAHGAGKTLSLEQTEFNKLEILKIIQQIKSGKSLAAFESGVTGGLLDEQLRQSEKVVLNADGQSAHMMVVMHNTYLNLMDGEFISFGGIPLLLNRSEDVKRAWEGIPRPFENKGAESVAKKFEMIQGQLSNPETLTDTTIADLEQGLQKDVGSILWQELIHSYHANLRPAEKQHLNLQKALMGQTLKEALGISELQAQIKGTINIKWRDRNMAESVGILVCRAIENGITIVYMRQGLAHTKGTFEALRRMIKLAGGEAQIELRVDEEYKNSPFISNLLNEETTSTLAIEIKNIVEQLEKLTK